MEATEDHIEIAKAIAGLRSAIAAAGADPNDHTDYILRYAAHGRIGNTEAEHSAIAARLVSSGTKKYEAPAPDPAAREKQLAASGILGGVAPDLKNRPDFEARQKELRTMGLL